MLEARSVAIFIVVLSVATTPTTLSGERQASHVFPRPGEWPCHRRNGSLDARSPAKGRLTRPKIVWKHFVGIGETVLVTEPGDADMVLTLPVANLGDRPDPLTDPRWGLAPPRGDLQGRRQPICNDAFRAYADVLAGTPGLEKLEVRREGTAACFVWRDNAWAKVWETERMDFGNTVTALPIVGDFDADGRPELAFLPWWHLVIVDAATGKLEDRCRFTKGRSYGYFGVHDLDGDGKSEFVVQADFAKHVDVLGYRDGKVELLWQRNIELDISNPQTILRVNPNTVADVDGDGRLEVLINLYNAADDGRWHVSVHDGMTGQVKYDLTDEHLDGVTDVDGDGSAELLTSRTTSWVVPAFGPIRVGGLKNGHPTTLWERADAGWQTWDTPMPLHVNSGATYGRRTVLARPMENGTAVVLRRLVPDRPDETTISVATWSEGGLHERTTVQGRRLEGLALDDRGNLLFRGVSRPGAPGRLQVRGGRVRAIRFQRQGVSAGTAVAARADDRARAVVVVQGSGEELVAFHPPRGDRQSKEIWRIPGRGQGAAWPGTLGPVLADLRADGGRQVIYAAAAPSGCGRLVAADLAGREVWHHDFGRIPGTPPVWNSGAIVLWQVGRFTNKGRQDVLVTVRRSMMHSEETVLLSGRDGGELWRRVRQDTSMHSRGVGGTPFALADYDGDGLDDVASFYPSQFYLLNGRTGENLILMNAVWDPVPTKPVYWGRPVAGDFEKTGRASVFMAGGAMTGLVRPDGTLVWHDAVGQSPVMFAFGDLDANGRIDAVGFGYPDGVRCYDAATGRVKWRMAMPAAGAPAGAASGDVDADGRDEVLLTVGKTLYCVGTGDDGKRGVVLWQVAMPTNVGPPSIADLDGDGNASVLLVGQDGHVYGVN